MKVVSLSALGTGRLYPQEIRGQFQNQLPIGWLKKMQNEEQNFI
jgi:hypothetical protein